MPERWRAKSQLNSAVRAPPICRKPVGEGAKRVTTCCDINAPDTLGREVEQLADFALRPGLAPVQAVAQGQDPALVVGEAAQELVDLAGQQGLGHQLERGLSRMVDHQVAQAGVAVLADGGVQADGVAVVVEQFGQHALVDLQRFGQFGQGGRAAVLGFELALDPAGAADLVADVGGYAHRVGRVLDGPADRLADPPGGVRGELEALAPVELLDGVDEAEVALLDEVGERQARPLVLTGDRDHEPEVGIDEPGGGVLAGHDLLAEVPLLAGG